jgi:hypothetical protein
MTICSNGFLFDGIHQSPGRLSHPKFHFHAHYFPRCCDRPRWKFIVGYEISGHNATSLRRRCSEIKFEGKALS